MVGIVVWELLRMLHGERLALPFAVSAALLLLLAMELPVAYALPLLLVPAILGISFLDDHKLTFSMFAVAILIAGYGMAHLRDDFGFYWMAWLALIVIATDILGYFAGRFIGGPKIWPKVSPKKTWSGTAAGWVGAVVIALGHIPKLGCH